MNKQRTRRRLTYAVLACAVGAGNACGDNTKNQLRAAQLAEGCALNSDCQTPYVCVFERCHVACAEDRDCEGEQRCMKGASADQNVCQLPDEIPCVQDKNCPGQQLCAVDHECRDACSTDSDCSNVQQICATSGDCASTLLTKDRLDDQHNILVDPFGEGGGAGASGSDAGGVGGASGSAAGGSAGASGSGVSGTAGGSGAGGGGESDGGAAGDSASGAAGQSAGGAGTSGAGGANGGAYVETPDGVEAVPNNDRDHTVPLVGTATIYMPAGDQDWFSVKVPDDGKAHVIALTLRQDPGMAAGVEVLAGSDFSRIGGVQTDAGVTSYVYVSVGPGTTSLVHFAPLGGSAVGKADITLTLTAELDDYEPNNTRSAAKPIALNTPITAQFIVPYTSQIERSPEDWYQVTLNQGSATFKLLSIPETLRLAIFRVDGQGTVSGVGSTAPGMIASFPISIATAGTYLVQVANVNGLDTGAFFVGTPASWLTQPYSFEIDQ